MYCSASAIDWTRSSWRMAVDGRTAVLAGRFTACVGAGRAHYCSRPAGGPSPAEHRVARGATMSSMYTVVLILDLIGTFVFALTGAMMGVRRRLDVFGVLVVAFAASSAGGITRDLL